MKLRLQRINQNEHRFTTLGYWFWDKPNNKGTLTIQISRMADRRHEWAVWGHELIEAFWCKLWGITTEKCDAYDEVFEKRFRAGEFTIEDEAGCQKDCPYHWGHMLGIVWEHVIIWLTCEYWYRYEQTCLRQMEQSASF